MAEVSSSTFYQMRKLHMGTKSDAELKKAIDRYTNASLVRRIFYSTFPFDETYFDYQAAKDVLRRRAENKRFSK